jgi:tetratricopeptide (TPR) repeat protein
VPASSPALAPSGSPRAVWLALGLLVAATVAAYWNSRHVPLLLDDSAALVDNPSIRRLWPLGPVLSPPSHVGTGGRPLDFPEASCARADALAALGRLPEAITHYRTAVAAKPALAAAHFGLGRALVQTGAVADALPHFEATARLVPDSRDAHFGAAGVAIAMQRWPDAERHLRTTLRLAPDSTDAHFALANVLAVTARPTEAIPHYETVLRARPDFAEARANLEIVRAAASPKAP